MSKQQKTTHSAPFAVSCLTLSGACPDPEHRTKYTYDPAGNLKTRYVLATTETFGVNALNELTNEWRSGTTFDVAGTTSSTATNVQLTVNGGIGAIHIIAD